MATQRSSFSKLQRDRDKQAKAAAKRDRRQNRDPITGEEIDDDTPIAPQVDPQELLAAVEQAHREFDAGVIDFDTYEERKASLLSQLPVD